MFNVGLPTNSSDSKRSSQDRFVDLAGDMDAAGIDILKNDLSGAEQQRIDLVEISARRFKNVEKRIAIGRGRH